MRPVRVDVVIPNWNGEALLARCLEALAAQTYGEHRVIVVDNGSSDGSRAVAEARGATWLPLGENLGFPAAVNAGIAAGDAPLVALLNNDALPEPGWLAALVAALERDPVDLVRRLAHALRGARGRHQRCRGRVRRARPRRLQPRHRRAGRPALRRAAARLRRLRRRGASTAARCSPTSASSTSASSSRSRTSTSTCAPRSPGTAASTCRRRRSCTSAAPPPARARRARAPQQRHGW